MIRARRTAAAALFLLQGCATTRQTLPVKGRNVEVTRLSPGKKTEAPPVKGELVAVGADRLFVLTADGLQVVGQSDVDRVRIELHRLNGAKAGLWVVVGAVVTGGVLAAACSSVEDAGNCGVPLLATLGIWGLIGGPSAVALGRSSGVTVRGENLAALRPYARYPQGLPEGLDPARLVAHPDPGSGAAR